MGNEHHYNLTIRWTGNTGKGTLHYRSYKRNHSIFAEGKPEILASSDPDFRGDRTKYNPEELLVASLSSCHMLWFLHLCADRGIVVIDYTDNPTGTMTETDNGGGKFKEVTLNPTVTIHDTKFLDQLDTLHAKAHELCFIANSVNFDVRHNARGKGV
jgi:organic hydroperoxide reductase OsmC/OhrA